MTEYAETIAPTPERMRHAGAYLERPHIDQRTHRTAHRVVGLVYTMHRDGKLPDECWRAHERFAADWETANRTSSAIGGYGERIGGSLGMSDTAEIRKALCWQRAGDAIASVASERGRRALVMSVSARPADEISTARPYTLEEIGRATSHYRASKEARASAMATLESALWQLHRFYEPG